MFSRTATREKRRADYLFRSLQGTVSALGTGAWRNVPSGEEPNWKDCASRAYRIGCDALEKVGRIR